MIVECARIPCAIGMKVEDYLIQGMRGWVRLHKKGAKSYDVLPNHNRDQYLEAYIRGGHPSGSRGATVPHRGLQRRRISPDEEPVWNGPERRIRLAGQKRTKNGEPAEESMRRLWM